MRQFNISPGMVGSEDLYYSGSDQEYRCVGHLRGDFGKSDDEYWASSWPHEGAAIATEGYRDDLVELVNSLRENLLKSRKDMRAFIQRHLPLQLDAGAMAVFGYRVSTEKYDYYIRCSPYPGEYDFYIYMYVKENPS